MTLVLWSLNFDETSMMNDLGDCKKPRSNDCFLNDVFSSFFLHCQQKEGRYVYEIKKKKKCLFYVNKIFGRLLFLQ